MPAIIDTATPLAVAPATAGCGREPAAGERPAPRSPRSSAPSARSASLLPDRTPKQLISVSSASAATATTPSGQRQCGQLVEIAREGDRDRRHAARLDDQQQRPAVEEGWRLAVGVAQIGILAADLRAAARQARRKPAPQPARSGRRAARPRRSVRGVSTCRATSAGLTKMPEPMIPPMTSMVASNRPEPADEAVASRAARPRSSCALR